ncbi:MAG: metallophosphoesterase family protein [Thermonemataceae bacterium]
MKYSIAHITDLHLDEAFPKKYGVDPQKNWRQVLRELSSKAIDEVVLGGDLGTLEALPALFEDLVAYPVTISLGNHDVANKKEIAHLMHYDYTEKTFYAAQDRVAFKVILLDTSTGYLPTEQLGWLKEALVTEKPVLIFMHYPVLSVDTYVDRKHSLKNRKEVLSILKESKQDIHLFSGHYHCEAVQQEENVIQYVTPAVAHQFEQHTTTLQVTNTTFGYRLITLDDINLHTEVVYCT